MHDMARRPAHVSNREASTSAADLRRGRARVTIHAGGPVSNDKQMVHVLLVDDDDVDVMGVKRAFKKAKIANPLHVARDGIEALAMLRGTGGNDAIPKPYIVILDLNMPRMDGLEFLDEVRKDPDHRDAVVFVLTTSKADEDRAASYDKNVAGYIVKSDVGEGFLNVTTLLDSYWRVVLLPS
jgi:CheY-like chemotaxis protein